MGIQQGIQENVVEPPILFFDGVCNFCHSSVQFIMKHDRTQSIHFASLQSELGQKHLTQAGLPTDDFDSLLFLENGTYYTSSSGALRTTRYMSGIWRLGSILLFIPRPIRDFAYSIIAKNRYQWFGESEQCMLPSQEERKRFLG